VPKASQDFLSVRALKKQYIKLLLDGFVLNILRATGIMTSSTEAAVWVK